MSCSEEDLVSIIVPTYNSAKTFSLCIDSVSRQQFANKEILVVDNYSSDETRSIAEAFSCKVILHKGTQAAARNVGIAHSKGRYVLFIDSDQQLGDGVVENCVSICSKLNVEAVKIPEFFVGSNFWGKCSALWKNSMAKASGLKGGIPRFYRKETLLKQSAFNDEFRWWEDQELYQRLIATGLKEAWCTSLVTHYETDSLKNTVRKYLSYGQSVTSFRRSEAKAPYAATFKFTLSTLAQILMNSRTSASVFFGCLFLVTVKSFSGAIGFLSGS